MIATATTTAQEAIDNTPKGMVWVHTHSIMDDTSTGGICGLYLTPDEKKAHEAGMAALAEMG